MWQQPVDEAWATVDGLRGDAGDRRFPMAGRTRPFTTIRPSITPSWPPMRRKPPPAARRGVKRNLSTTGWDETCVCLGDCYQVGEALLQVTQPRKPCWKINARLEVEQLSMFIAEHSLTGWSCAASARPVVAGRAGDAGFPARPTR